MEGGDSGQAVPINLADELAYSLAHFLGCLVGERYSENVWRMNAVGPNQVSHAMGDDASLTAPRAGQDKERAFDVCNRFALLWIQALEKVHERGKFHCSIGPGEVLNDSNYRGWVSGCPSPGRKGGLGERKTP